ncbi:flagellar protein FliS [Acidisoma sp.]|uniref:flagellar protein FliS n=1 Tax=Acidisoma sp. TaxID=1872115 RepID=UPI003B003776
MFEVDLTAGYRAGLFDGEPGIGWLRPGWLSLRLYGQHAKAAIEAGDTLLKANMILSADRLLTIMSGILDTSPGTTLGPAMMSIYNRLRFCLWKANVRNDCAALDDYDKALQTIDKEFLNLSKHGATPR